MERPDILDDPDTTTLPVSKLKSFLDSTLAEVHTVERWTTARIVRNQLRIICDNRVNDDAEPKKNTGYVSLKAFMDMIQPAFPDKASKQDIMACLKRSHWVANLRHGVYLRPAGTSNDEVMCVAYTDGVDDFISPEGKKVLGLMKDGCKTPPSDWITKRQWSHDLLSMLIEHRKKPPRTAVIMAKSPFTHEVTRREIKPSLAFSGRICSDFLAESHAQESSGTGEDNSADTLPKELVKVKEEIETAKSFPGLLAGSMPGVIDLDSPSPTPTKRRKTDVSEMDVVSDTDAHSADDCFPQVGAEPED